MLGQVLGIFVAEVREQAQSIADALLAMEHDAAAIPTRIEELFRHAHNLKGSAASLGVGELEALAHELESALTGVRRRNEPLTTALVDAGLRAMDAVQQRTAGLLASDDEGMDAVAARTAELRAFTSRPQPRAEADAPPSVPVAVPEVERSAEAAPSEPALLGDDPSSVRLPAELLLAFERRTDDLRSLQGRLERHARELAHTGQLLERLTRELAPAESGVRGPSLGRREARQVARTLRSLRRELLEDAESLQGASSEFAEALRALRLVPASLLRQPLVRTVREACRLAGREAELVLSGDHVFLDRTLLEELRSPLVHLLRNAVDHGIEPVAARIAQGKPPCGRIQLSLTQQGGQIVIAVSDDGRGIDAAAVRERAVARGFVAAQAAQELDEQGTYQLLLRSGFSTADQITALSGRGVGLDVVRESVERLSGRLHITSQPGRGTTFTLAVPMTLLAAQVLLLEEPDGLYALPQASVERILLVPHGALQALGKRTVYKGEQETLVVARLASLLGGRGAREWPARLPLVVLAHGEQRVALTCERLVGEAELLLQPLPLELRRHAALSAVALRPTGEVLLVLNPTVLVERALDASLGASVPSLRTVLVADDSITTRSLLRSVLEGGGYRVRTAADGEEVLRLLRSESVDLVVSDVQMPRLDGIALVERLRSDARTARLPVVLFSSADSEEDKRRGAASGAAAYLTKGAFERGQLVDVVNNLLRGL
ncbi:MAG: response regulator [Polyangia bacterium]